MSLRPADAQRTTYLETFPAWLASDDMMAGIARDNADFQNTMRELHVAGAFLQELAVEMGFGESVVEDLCHKLGRVAMGLAINEIDPEKWTIKFYDLLSSFDFMSSTPTLFNSGTLRPQLSSCYLTSIPDNLDGIFSATSMVSPSLTSHLARFPVSMVGDSAGILISIGINCSRFA